MLLVMNHTLHLPVMCLAFFNLKQFLSLSLTFMTDTFEDITSVIKENVPVFVVFSHRIQFMHLWVGTALM